MFSSFSMSCEGLFHALQARALISFRGLDKNLQACCGNIWFFFGVLWGLFSRLQTFLFKIQGVYCIISWHPDCVSSSLYGRNVQKIWRRVENSKIRSSICVWQLIHNSHVTNIKHQKSKNFEKNRKFEIFSRRFVNNKIQHIKIFRFTVVYQIFIIQSHLKPSAIGRKPSI